MDGSSTSFSLTHMIRAGYPRDMDNSKNLLFQQKQKVRFVGNIHDLRSSKLLAMLTMNVLLRMKMKSFSRHISFFKKKKPACIKDGSDDIFDMKTCLDRKTSNLRVKDSCSLEGCCSIPKVIVVGAGLSGLSAGARLVQAGIKDLVVLEATSRVGGRIMSSWVGDAMIEFGPTVLYGASMANPVYNLANMSGAVTFPVKRQGPRKSVLLTSDGNLISDIGVETLILQQLLKDARGRKGKSPPSCTCESKTNLMQYLGLRLQQELLSFPTEMQAKAERVLWGLLHGMRACFGAELSLISADALADQVRTPGGNIILEGGMSRIIGPLIQEIPDESIILNSPVHKVRLNPCPRFNEAVNVITCDGKCLQADYVIVTVPLGVLKKRGDDMFDGALKKEQMDAIRSIGVGLQNHVYLEYARPWWIPGMADMKLAWSMQELHLSSEWTKGVVGIQTVPGSKHLLAVEIAGPEAELIEKVAEEEVAIQITKFLRKFVGDTSIPFPSNIVVTRWSCDPFFYGSKVYMAVGTSPGMFKDLGVGSCTVSKGGPPVPPIILAGDATIAHYYGTMEGARRSGLRAADSIVRVTKAQCAEEDRQREIRDQEERDGSCCGDGDQQRVHKCCP